MLVFKAYELKKHKINKNTNKQAKFINHAKQHCFIVLPIRRQKIKDIMKQISNKLIKLENNQFR